MRLGEDFVFTRDRNAYCLRLYAAHLALTGDYDKAAKCLLAAEDYARQALSLRAATHEATQ